jgi:RNA polymerase sigma factor (sigma-70 family)
VREIGQALEVADEVVLEAWQARRDLTCASLNQHASGHDESDATRQDAIGIEDAGFLRAQQRATIDQLSVILTERERRGLKLRFDEDLTQEQIGHRIGVSQMQVSRLIRGALAKLAEAASRPEHPLAAASRHGCAPRAPGIPVHVTAVGRSGGSAMAKDHGSSVKNDKQYEGLRKKGMSKSRAAAISNSPDSSSRGGKSSGSSRSKQSSGSGSGGNKAQKAAAGRKGGKRSS